MISGVSRYLLVVPLLGLPASGAAQRGPEARPERASTVAEQVEDWFRTTTRRAPGDWGVAVADQTGRLLWGVEPTRPLIPASTVKVLTTGYARSVLGPEARKSTRVVGHGRLDHATGAWLGTWALELNGDPSLERGDGAGPRLSDLAEQLVDRGIRRLTGPLTVISAVGEADAIWPSSWAGRHRGRVFAPLVGNLTVNNNLLSLALVPGSRVGARVELVAAAPDGLDRLVSVTATTVEGRRSRLALTSRNGRYVVTGTLGIRAGTRSIIRASDDPRSLLEAAWSAALSRAGIEWAPSDALLTADAQEPKVLAEVRSQPFDSLASEINRRSSNLGAELLLQWAAEGDREAADRLTAHVRQITGDYTGVHLVDGSGLSSDNRVAPLTFISYLSRFPVAPGGRNFPMLLPPNGAGTLGKLGSGLPQQGVVRAKTGTLGNVASLVGYLGRPDGVLLLSLIYNGTHVYDAKQAQWQLFRLLGAEGVVVPADSLDQSSLGSDPSR